MGFKARARPRQLAGKLREIRIKLGLSQSEFVKHLELQDVISYPQLSAYECGSREPSLQVLLRYARAAGICMDVLVDDRLKLPRELPATHVHSGVKVSARKRGGGGNKT